MIYFSITVALLGFLIPLFLLVKKEKLCGKKSFFVFLISEILSIAIFCLLNYKNVEIFDLCFYIAEMCIFSALAYIDAKEKVVETDLLLALLVISAVSCVRTNIPYIIDHICAAFVGFAIMFIVNRLKTDQVGKGDVYIVPVIGLAIGLGPLFRTMFMGMFIMTLYGVVGMILKKINLKSELPMLPFVYAGWVLCII